MTNQQKLFDSTKKYVCRRMNSFSTTIVYRITVFFVPVKWFCKLERIFDWRIKTLSTNTSVTFIAADDTSYLFDSSLAQGDEFVLKDKHPSDTPPLLISFLNLPRRWLITFVPPPTRPTFHPINLHSISIRKQRVWKPFYNRWPAPFKSVSFNEKRPINKPVALNYIIFLFKSENKFIAPSSSVVILFTTPLTDRNKRTSLNNSATREGIYIYSEAS